MWRILAIAVRILRPITRRFRKFPFVTRPRSLQSAWLRRRLARRPLRAVPALHGLLPTLPLVHQRSESPLRRGTADSPLLAGLLNGPFLRRGWAPWQTA